MEKNQLSFKETMNEKPMKESTLIRKMKAIEAGLKKSNIVDKCYNVARNHGQGRTEELSYHTKLDYNFNQDDLSIKFSDGWGQGGGGEIKVFYRGEQVLYGDRYALDDIENKFNPKIDDFCIMTYHPGEWEPLIEKILTPKKEKPAKQEKPVEKGVDEELVKRLTTNFAPFQKTI